MHLNVCSLTEKIDKLKELIKSLHKKKIEVDVILLCETFFHTEALKLVQIPNFSSYYNNGEHTTDRRIAIYVNDKFHHKAQLDIDVFEESYYSLNLSSVKWPFIRSSKYHQKYIEFQILLKISLKYRKKGLLLHLIIL